VSAPDDPGEGGATCSVTFTPETVVKRCLEADLELEYKLTQNAAAVLGSPRVVRMMYDASSSTLTMERIQHGVAYDKRRGVRTYWATYGNTDDSPKLGTLRGFSEEATEKLVGDVRRLHQRGIAHNDIHAGNIGITAIDPATGIVTDAILIDYSEAVDLSMLTDLRGMSANQIGRGIRKNAAWFTPYVAKVMAKNIATPDELFEAARKYDLDQLRVMGLLTDGGLGAAA
jgi:tRNA A-37 threonylcarbamoyl transferase component Bud32